MLDSMSLPGKVGASKLPGPEMRKHRKKDGTETSVRWRFQSIAIIKDNTVLFQSHGMPSDAKTHTLETEKMDTASAEALQRRMVAILAGHSSQVVKYNQCYAIMQPHLSYHYPMITIENHSRDATLARARWQQRSEDGTANNDKRFV